MAKPKIISLFTGAGGLDLGFEAAGCETAVAVEMDADAVKTLRHNRKWPVIDRDIHTIPTSELLETAGLKEGRERRMCSSAVRRADVENHWIGHELAAGGSARISVAMPDPRCVMTTLGQGDIPRDIEVLRALVKHNRIQVGDGGRFPCAGVYAVVSEPGVLRVGDPVLQS